MSGIGQKIGFLPDPLNVHKSSQDGGLGFPDPLGLFDSLPKPKEMNPLPAELQTPAAMPVPTALRDDAAAKTAKRKSITAQRQRRGRSSTIMTALNDEADGKLGG